MKKILSLTLAIVIAFSCLSLVAFAEDEPAYTKSYFVEVAPEFKNMIEITSTDGLYCVKEGEPFSFTIKAINGYRFDQTTVVKYGNTHQHVDVLLAEKETYGEIIYPDANGVYTIQQVNEDLYIYTGLLNKKNISSIKDFLYNLFSFFRNLVKWFFGLR